MRANLLGSTKGILSSLQRETGQQVLLVPDQGRYLSSALVSAREKNGDGGHVIIAYNPEAKSIDYAIARESLRFLRFLRAPPQQRLMLASDPETSGIAYSGMEKDIVGKPGILRDLMRKGFGYFYDGILKQMVNTPGDFWINERLYQDCPGLRGEQRKGLDEIFRSAHIRFGPEVEEVTPHGVYEASHAMNAALSIYADGLLHTERYSRPYQRRGFREVGKHLHDLNPSDKGYVGDIAAVNAWAERLDLKGWFKWRGAEGPS